VLAAAGLWGGLAAEAGPALAGAGLYAAPAAIGAASCADPADACTLATALADAAAGDTVYLVQPGAEGTASTYYIGNWSVGTAGTSAGAQVTIAPAPGLASAPILDGDGTSAGACQTGSCDGPVLSIGSGVYATVQDVTIQDARNTTTILGGGIHNGDGATLTVSGSTFTGNSARDGGAIDNADFSGAGTLTVTGSTFTGNSAISDGGAIDNADNADYGGTVTVSGSTFTGNSAGDGGAIDSADGGGGGALTVSDSTFTGNSAHYDGGAIDNGDTGGGALTVTDSTFTGNSARDGGAIDNGDDYGGGTLTVSDSTFSGNSATDGGAIDNGDFYGSGTVSVAADIFDGSCDQAGGSWADAGYNAGTDGTCENGGTADSTALTAAELGPLAGNGGPTQTVLPLAGNPALGIVPVSTSVMLGGASVALCPVTDQRGVASVAGLACNAGAVQGPAGLYAAPAAIGAGDCSSAADACLLATALSEAAPGYTVYLVQPGTEGTPGSYYIGNWSVGTPGTSAGAQVTIAPVPGLASAPILDGDGTNAGTCETGSCDGPVLSIGSGVYATVQGVTIQDADNTATLFGGGIANLGGGTLTVTGSTFTGNQAGEGGAIDNADGFGGTVTVSGSTFTGNQASDNGGAIDNGDEGGSGTVTVSDSTFAGNTASDGGAIDNCDFYGGGTLTVSDSTFTGNTAVSDGGAIDNGDHGGGGTLAVSDSTFTGNTASGDGGTIDDADNGGSGTVSVAADIFDGSCGVSAGGSWADAGYNAGTDATCENGGTADSTALTPAELGPLAGNGGPTQTVLPLAWNPALGIVPASTSVTLDGSPVALCPVTDQRGVASAPGAACDAGAVQVQAARPAVTGVTPGAGTDAGGTPITITGRNFAPGAKVELGPGPGPGPGPGAVLATGVDVLSPAKITATAGGPARPGNWHVFVITAGGTSKASPRSLYQYDAPPVVYSLSPARGPAGGGTTVTIGGCCFSPGASVLFGAAAAGHVSYVSARELTVTAPPGSGTVTVTVTTPGGTSRRRPHDHYHYT